MTTRPRLASDVNYRNGVGALLLFVVLAWTYLSAEFPAPRGFGEGEITRSIGFAMFDMLEQIPQGHGETEGFLVAFIVIAVVLDAALDGAVMLARREEDGTIVSAIADGGFVGGTDDGASDSADGTVDAMDGEDAADYENTADATTGADATTDVDATAGGED